MGVTIQLSPLLAKQLQAQADRVHLPLQEYVIGLLLNLVTVETQKNRAFDSDYYDLDNVVARIQALPPNPSAIHPPTASLAEALQSLPDDPDFDLAEWERQWALAEMEISIPHI